MIKKGSLVEHHHLERKNEKYWAVLPLMLGGLVEMSFTFLGRSKYGKDGVL